MSLRMKLVLALMLSGLVAVLTVGGVAYYELQRKFASRYAQQATEHFRALVAGYLGQHGDWPPGLTGRSLGAFIQSQSQAQPQAAGLGVPLDERGLQRPRPRDAEPPFRFVLADGNYRVLLGAGIYRDGEPLPFAARPRAEPVEIGGAVRAYISTEGVLSAGPEDQAYLDIMRQALIYGAGCAAALALLVGLVLAQGLSASLRRLTLAVQAMRGGDLRQSVPPRGGAEERSLASAFNAMSEALASSHEALRASHATISAQAAQLQELSQRDALTGLHNRRHFDAELLQLYAQSRRDGTALSVVVADIDFFKRINDSHSHAIGDQVLCQVAALLSAATRRGDLLARWGGEEFVLALPQTRLPQAAALCEQLRGAVERFPWEQIAAGLRVTLSLGLHDDQRVGSGAAMLDRADAQLYRAKEAGRNRLCFAADPAAAASASFTVA